MTLFFFFFFNPLQSFEPFHQVCMGKPLVSYTGSFQLTRDNTCSLSSFICSLYMCKYMCVWKCVLIPVPYANHTLHAVIKRQENDWQHLLTKLHYCYLQQLVLVYIYVIVLITLWTFEIWHFVTGTGQLWFILNLFCCKSSAVFHAIWGDWCIFVQYLVIFHNSYGEKCTRQSCFSMKSCYVLFLGVCCVSGVFVMCFWRFV